MKYLVTGGAGFIGSNLVDELISDGHEVVVLDNLTTGKLSNVNKSSDFHCVDINSLDPTSSSVDPNYWDKILKLMDGVDTVFHLAALARVQPSIDDPHTYNRTNVTGTLNMLHMAHKAEVRRFVFTSSSSVYGDVLPEDLPTHEDVAKNPLSPYGLQKLVGEHYSRMYSEVYGLETVSLRYFNVYGERQPLSGAYALVMGIFANQRLNDKPMTINGDGEQRRDFTYVKDVARANILASESKYVGKGEAINIGNGDNRSVNEMAEMIGGPTVNLDPVIEPRETMADNTKAYKLLGWQPTATLEEWMPSYKESLGL